MDHNALTWGGGTTDEERTMALLAHLSTFLIPVIGPLVLWAIKKDSSRFVGYHAIQAAIFQGIAYLIGTATCGVGLLLLILPIVWALKAHRGEWVGYPLIEGIGKT